MCPSLYTYTPSCTNIHGEGRYVFICGHGGFLYAALESTHYTLTIAPYSSDKFTANSLTTPTATDSCILPSLFRMLSKEHPHRNSSEVVPVFYDDYETQPSEVLTTKHGQHVPCQTHLIATLLVSLHSP